MSSQTPTPDSNSRLQLQTPTPDFVDGGHLDMEMTFWEDKSLTNVNHAMKIGVLNIPAPVRMTPCPPRFYLTNQII